MFCFCIFAWLLRVTSLDTSQGSLHNVSRGLNLPFGNAWPCEDLVKFAIFTPLYRQYHYTTRLITDPQIPEDFYFWQDRAKYGISNCSRESWTARAPLGCLHSPRAMARLLSKKMREACFETSGFKNNFFCSSVGRERARCLLKSANQEGEQTAAPPLLRLNITIPF